MNRQDERLAEILKREIGQILEEEIDILPGTLVSITDIKVEPKTKTATIKYSVYPDANKKIIFKNIRKNQRAILQRLKSRIKVKYLPELKFQFDEGFAIAAEVESLLDADKMKHET